MQLRIPEVTLIEEAGRGPGSIVFRGLHHGNHCLVKVPSDRPPPLADSLARSFEQDVLVLARLGRSGLPRVLQLGTTAETPYAILDAAQGRPLVDVMAGGQLTDADAVSIVLCLAMCLQQLHQAGFVHGSLTTDHILLSHNGTRVGLLDTGSVSRPVPFDPRVDTKALGLVVTACLHRLSAIGEGPSLLAVMADDLTSGRVSDLSGMIAELAFYAEPQTRRRSSYPPPSRESVIATATRPARGERFQLTRIWDRAAKHGGRIVEVLGPAGSGKSRLLSAFAEEMGAANVQVMSVKCRDSDWAPFSALKRLLEGHLAGLSLLDSSRRTEIETSLRRAAGPMASRIRLLSPALGALFGNEPNVLLEGDAQQVFVAGTAEFLATYLEWSGRSVFVIDDIHWLDASSRMVLSQLAARLCPQGHVFVCAARDDLDSKEPLERFRAALAPEFVESLQIGPLSEPETSDVIADYLGLDYLANGELAEQLSHLSDGTPLSLLELLRLTLDRGYLRPHAGMWRLDTAAVQRMRLSASSQALIERRVSLLDQATAEVLRVAALIRSRIDPELLARVIELDLERICTALDRALDVQLLELDASGAYCFVHDCVWEALLLGLSATKQRALHQRVADTLAIHGGDGPDYEYELARHHAAGVIEHNPRRAFEVTRRAARRALEACDDTLALSFLKPAEAAAQLANLEPGREFYVELAETSLRTGATLQSHAYFERALERSLPGFERAHVYGRIAWIHHYESNAEACWASLETSLNECGRASARSDTLALLAAGADTVAHTLGAPTRELSQEDARTLCELYGHCTRVAVDNGRPTRGIASALRMAIVARQLGPCRAVVHANLFTAFITSSLGADAHWRAGYARAVDMAQEINDPIAQTLCHQFRHVIAGWQGDLEEAERQARICVDQRGHWMELGDLCHMCFGMYGIEMIRGRPEVALAWAERAVERARQSGHAPAIFALLEDAARTTLLILGREKEIKNLERRLQFVERAEVRRGSYFYLLSFQSRVQRFTEQGDLGEAFETLIEEFERLGSNPRQVHLAVVMYYVHVAHARVHQCLRSAPASRAALLPKLKRALRDLQAAARVPVIEAHALVTDAAYRWLCGSRSHAERLLAQAEGLAREHDVVWVRYAAARLRAHMLRADDKTNSAQDEAHIAAFIARQHNQLSRLRFINEEFSLSEPGASTARSETEAPSMRRHLDALLHISQANSRELSPERQARFILDELLETVDAERALLFMRDNASNTLSLRAGRSLGNDVAADVDYQRALVEQVYATGQTESIETADARIDGGLRADRACLVVALVLREQAVGVLYLDRPGSKGGFGSEDAALLQALANQVPVALELAGALRERDRLHQNLRQAQKMEAVGRLAGGIAHDFNNILTAIQISAHGLACLVDADHEGHEEIEDIQDSARRGADLTRQLLTLSRGQQILPRRIILGEVVEELTPMLHRLVRSDVRIEMDIAETPLPTLADPGGIERVLMNLCQNASDAMHDGGTITIRVANGTSVASRGADEGYVLLAVSDTGAGMSEEVRSRLFEPFFTTKGGQRGTGLGLANVYAIVQQCRGRIEVSSELGVGSTFRIYLPRCLSVDDHEVEDAGAEAEAAGGEVVLLAGHTDAGRQEMASTLERAGYQVLSARNAHEAVRLIDGYDGLLDLVVSDVQMPDMTGAQLASLLLARDADLRFLFVSGTAPAELRRNGLLVEDAAFLHRPFVPDALLARVLSVLHDPATDTS